MTRLFGTDGVRGVANAELTPELVLALCAAAVAELDLAGQTAVIGRDTRPSGELLEAAATAGLLAAGAHVVRLGIAPTPAVAHAVAAGLPAGKLPSLGVMISASHNPMPDNGIKFFGRGGVKLSDEVETGIEARITQTDPRPIGSGVGRLLADPGGLEWYVDHLVSTVGSALDGLRIVVDCANGAAGVAAPAAYRRAGAEVVVINDDLAGDRINDNCGATHPESLRAAVREHRADAGIAHDGDADRCVAVDAQGQIVDGDGILAVLALAMHERGELTHDTVAATIMSNLGFHHAMKAHGITVAETAVGDRQVLQRMTADGLSLGGEQSGHVILADHAMTGDGILTGLHLLARMATTGRSLADLASVMTRLPQVLVNVPVADKAAALAASAAFVAAAESELGAAGRVLVRPSGTEALLRVMVEAPTEEQASAVAGRIAAALS